MKHMDIRPGDTALIRARFSSQTFPVVVRTLDRPNRHCFMAVNGEYYAYMRVVHVQPAPEVAKP
jgi:hypothetical protein